MNDKLKELRKIVRECDRYSLRFYREENVPSYSNDCTVEFNGYQKDVTKTLILQGRIRNGNTSFLEGNGREAAYVHAYAPKRGFWSPLYDSQLRSAVKAFPSDVEPIFEVGLDYGTTGTITQCKIHADWLSLIGLVNGSSTNASRFLIDVRCGPHNFARFGAPRHEDDTEGGINQSK